MASVFRVPLTISAKLRQNLLLRLISHGFLVPKIYEAEGPTPKLPTLRPAARKSNGRRSRKCNSLPSGRGLKVPLKELRQLPSFAFRLSRLFNLFRYGLALLSSRESGRAITGILTHSRPPPWDRRKTKYLKIKQI